MNCLNSIILEGKVASIFCTDKAYFYLDVTREEGAGNETTHTFTCHLLSATADTLGLKIGSEVRIVGHIVQGNELGTAVVEAEHVEIKEPKVPMKTVKVLVEEVVSETFDVEVPSSASDEDVQKIIRDKYLKGEIVLEPGELEYAHCKIFSGNSKEDMNKDWVSLAGC